MPNEQKAEKLSGAEEYIAAEIDLQEPLDPAQEKTLRDALEKMDRRIFDSLDIGRKKISVCYDPTRLTKDELLETIIRSGVKLSNVESEGSPLL